MLVSLLSSRTACYTRHRDRKSKNDIRRRRIILTSPEERNQVFETHSAHGCFIYMRFGYRYYQSFKLYIRAGQLEPKGRPNISLNTRLMATLVHTYIAKGGGD